MIQEHQSRQFLWILPVDCRTGHSFKSVSKKFATVTPSTLTLREVVGFRFFATENSHNVFHRHDVELIVWFKIDGDRVFGMEQDFVILSERNRFILFYLMTYRDNPTGDSRDFG